MGQAINPKPPKDITRELTIAEQLLDEASRYHADGLGRLIARRVAEHRR